MKKIAFDIDGTISSPYYWRKLLNEIYNKNLTEEECTYYDIFEMYGSSFKDFRNGGYDLFRDIDIRTDFLEFIKLIETKYEICFITARDKSLDYEKTMDYLKKYSLDKYELHMLSSHYKVEKAKELGIELFFEDSGKNALELAEAGINVFLLDTNYNKEANHKNIKRINSYKECFTNF